MKKLLAAATAAALMFASTGVALGAFVWNNQGAFQTTNGMAISNSGHNYAGGMFTGQTTGQSYSYSVVGSGANWATIADHCSDCINPNLPVAKLVLILVGGTGWVPPTPNWKIENIFVCLRFTRILREGK